MAVGCQRLLSRELILYLFCFWVCGAELSGPSTLLFRRGWGGEHVYSELIQSELLPWKAGDKSHRASEPYMAGPCLKMLRISGGLMWRFDVAGFPRSVDEKSVRDPYL